MLRNFVNDEYLEKFFPDLVNYRKGGQVDYSSQTATAFELILDELTNKGIDPRRLMTGLDLNRSDTVNSGIQQLTSKTASATENGYAWEGGTQRRFVLNLTNKSVAGDDWSFILQGSNSNDRPDDGDSSWETVSTIQYDANTEASEENSTFTSLYKWYRLRVVKTSGSGSVTFTASIYETIFDPIIAYKTLCLVSSSWQTGLAEKWDVIREQKQAEYDAAMQAVKFSYDSDDDGEAEIEETHSASVRFIR
jgi:hypothetical protein